MVETIAVDGEIAVVDVFVMGGERKTVASGRGRRDSKRES